jgi:bifunctional ADP-heptose synthase (sugar kinase/adenylyltransferase)
MKKILVIGDIMVDRYVYLRGSRCAPESKLPVWDVVKVEERPGGAANVAANVRAMTPPDWNVTICGLGGVSIDGVKRACLVIPPIPDSMYKTRYIENDSMAHLLRVDNYKRFRHEDVTKLARTLQRSLDRDTYDAVIVSDYDKGTVVAEMMDLIKHIPLKVVDSKRLDLRIFSGFDILKVNNDEYAAQGSVSYYHNVESMFGCVVVTKGADGAELRVNAPDLCQKHSPWITPGAIAKYGTHVAKFGVQSVDNVIDITGAGDTHTAAMTVSLLSGADIYQAIHFANRKARNVVSKFGTSTPDLEEQS